MLKACRIRNNYFMKTLLIILTFFSFNSFAANSTSALARVVRVENYKDANYAYCSFKDRGVIIDLNEVNLQDNCREKVYFGVKNCLDDRPIHWMPDSTEVEVEVYEGQPRIYFLEYWESKLLTTPEHNGLMKKPAGWMLEERMSECYFIQTHDTFGLPFSDEYACR
jgi:hypothetical protein